MIITKIHVENFGKLHNIDINLSKGLNQIYKENGWGKSSLTVFIKAMFYGMPPKARGDAFNYERSKYMPWQGGNYGGFIEFKAFNKKYRLIRYFAKTPEGDTFELQDLTNNQIIQKPIDEIGDVLFGVGKETFEVTSFFPQLKFTSSATAQITANLTGVDKFKNDLSNFNQAIKLIDAKISSLKKEKPKKDEIDKLKKNLSNNKILIASNNQQIERTAGELKVFEEDIVSHKDLLSTAKEKNQAEQDSFNKKIQIEDSLREKNEKVAECLLQKNQILENQQKNDKAIRKSEKEESLRKASFILPIISVIAVILCNLFVIFKLIDIWIPLGVMGGIILISVVSELIIIKKWKDSKRLREVRVEASSQVDLLKELDDKILNFQREIDKLNMEYKDFKDIENPSREQIDEFESKVNVINYEIISKTSKLDNMQKEVDELIESTDIIAGEYDKLKEKYEEIDNKIKTLTLTKDYMQRAMENVSTRFIVPINESFSNLLNEFGVNDREFVIDTEWNVKEKTDYGNKEFQYSSQGLQDIISFCQRINLISEVYKKEKPILILDDTFVNLDDNKSRISKEIVKRISQDYQIIYICCNISNVIEG